MLLNDGQAKILDCKHVFDSCVYVKIGKEWMMFMFADRADPCEKCGTKDMRCVSVYNKATHCHICGIELNDDAPVRNYVLGANRPVDEHIEGILQRALGKK